MSLLSPKFLNAVVAIGMKTPDDDTEWLATGFFYGQALEHLEGNQWRYRIFLVTNRHVAASSENLVIGMNRIGSVQTEIVNLVDNSGQQVPWVFNNDASVDIAVIPMSFQRNAQDLFEFEYFSANGDALRIVEMERVGLSEGDAVYTLGYPMGLVGEEKNLVVTRSGCIARVRDLYSGKSKSILLDTYVFPGNSGGPVVSRPESMAISGTQSVETAHLIGVVSGYIPYQDTAISRQTKRVRVIFEENSGLSRAIPVDEIDRAILNMPAEHPVVYLAPPI